MRSSGLLLAALLLVVGASCDRRSERERHADEYRRRSGEELSQPLDPRPGPDIVTAANTLAYCRSVSVAAEHKPRCVEQAFKLAEYFRLSEQRSGCHNVVKALEIEGARRDSRWAGAIAQVRALCCDGTANENIVYCDGTGARRLTSIGTQ